MAKNGRTLVVPMWKGYGFVGFNQRMTKGVTHFLVMLPVLITNPQNHQWIKSSDDVVVDSVIIKSDNT
jgi:hypothetical protein